MAADLPLLIRTHVRKTSNFIRHEFDRGTVLRVLLLLVLVVVGGGRGVNLVSKGARDSMASLVFFTFLCATASFAVRVSRSDSAVTEMLPFSGRVLFLFESSKRAMLPLLLALLWSGPRLVESIQNPGWIAAIAVSTAIMILVSLSSAVLATWVSRRFQRRPAWKTARPETAGRSKVRVGGLQGLIPANGPMTAILRQDACYLVRRNVWTLLLPGFAVPGVAITSLRSGSLQEGGMILILLQGIAALLIVNQMLVLFDKDAENIDTIRMLPVTGRELWKARWLEAMALTALPGIAGSLVLLVRFGVAGASLLVPGIVLLISLVLATLYANIGLSLLSHNVLSRLFLNLAWGLPLLLWFLVPPVSVVILVTAIGWGMHTAPRTYDRRDFT